MLLKKNFFDSYFFEIEPEELISLETFVGFPKKEILPLDEAFASIDFEVFTVIEPELLAEAIAFSTLNSFKLQSAELLALQFKSVDFPSKVTVDELLDATVAAFATTSAINSPLDEAWMFIVLHSKFPLIVPDELTEICKSSVLFQL